MDLVSVEDVRKLLEYFSKSTYNLKDNDSEAVLIEKKCKELFSKDYVIHIIDNSNGALAATYPSQLIIPELNASNCILEPLDESDSSQDTEVKNLRDLMTKAKGARCRTRFPVPVIPFEGKYICRSATLSGGVEIYGREAYDFFFSGVSGKIDNGGKVTRPAAPTASRKEQSNASDWQLFTKVRSQDIQLLKQLHVGYICDLMVENKKVKYGVNVTSSEKIDKENRYSDFVILSLPYPGCEFFHEYRENSYSGEDLIYDWSQNFVDAQLDIPKDDISSHLDIEWNDYTKWDVITLTKNYLKLLMKYINEGTSGLLIHCISGWDRTPLFISLMRLSLWADGKIHPSLSVNEILFLTVAYDWFLFGHNLPDRLSKGEEIFFFCFYILKFLETDDFSVNHNRQKEKLQKDNDGSNVSESDCILLEESGARGSNTSLNSSSSSISSRSQDNPPAYFTNHCQDSGDETPIIHTNGNVPATMQSFHHQCIRVIPHPQSIAEDSLNGKYVPLPTKNKDTNQISNWSESDNYHLHMPFIGTSPVAVPSSVRQRSESSSSTGCGSWQIITTTGSVRGTSSTRSSISSPTYELNQNTNKQTIIHDCEEMQEKHCQITNLNLPITRKDKLYEARKTFYNCYSASIGFKYKNIKGQSIFDHFVEKVGIRSGRNYTT